MKIPDHFTPQQLEELAIADTPEKLLTFAHSQVPPLSYGSVERYRRLLRKEDTMTGKKAESGSVVPTQEELDQYLAEHWDNEARKFLTNYRPLPPVPDKIQTTHIDKMELGEHQAVALFSDYHFGSKIDTRATGGLAEYNEEIAKVRLSRWRDGILRFTQMTQAIAKVKVLHIFALGDDLEGHGEMFGTQALQLEESVFFQYMGFVNDVTNTLTAFLQRFDKVIVHKVYGNHGRISAKSKTAYGPDNLELMAWNNIKDRCLAVAPDRFEFNISTSFFLMLEIMGYTFYLRHGHMIGGLKQTYTGAFQNKLAMNSIVGEVINFMIKAHLHEAGEIEGEIMGSVIQNGCFVGPSLLSVEGNRAAANLPSQEFFMVHPKHGVTHRHRIYLASVKEVRKVKVWGRK